MEVGIILIIAYLGIRVEIISDRILEVLRDEMAHDKITREGDI